MRKKSVVDRRMTTRAEARIDFKPRLRGAEAPLFHGGARIRNFFRSLLERIQRSCIRNAELRSAGQPRAAVPTWTQQLRNCPGLREGLLIQDLAGRCLQLNPEVRAL